MSDSTDQDLGFRVVYADGLQPGDRSIHHGGLWVTEVRDSARWLDCVEVDFRDDDGRRDTFVIVRSELLPVIRTRPDGYEFDHQDDEDHQDDDHQDDDAERW